MYFIKYNTFKLNLKLKGLPNSTNKDNNSQYTFEFNVPKASSKLNKFV